jgi:hypothetical protein
VDREQQEHDPPVADSEQIEQHPTQAPKRPPALWIALLPVLCDQPGSDLS